MVKESNTEIIIAFGTYIISKYYNNIVDILYIDFILYIVDTLNVDCNI